MLGTQAQMEEHVLSVLSTSSNPDWGLLLARRVLLTLPLELVVSLTQRVSATLVSREQMEPHVHSAWLAHTKRDWVLLLALHAKLVLTVQWGQLMLMCVPKTRSLWKKARFYWIVHVKQGTMVPTVVHVLPVWLEHTKV